MFICQSCYSGWFIATSFGPCEVCGKTAPCDDVPSKVRPVSPEVAPPNDYCLHADCPDCNARRASRAAPPRARTPEPNDLPAGYDWGELLEEPNPHHNID